MTEQTTAQLKTVDDRLTMQLIHGVAKRASSTLIKLGHVGDCLGIAMDLEFCHANGCPLDLAGLATARDADLLHDVCGINKHLDHATGKLTDCFLPRFAL